MIMITDNDNCPITSVTNSSYVLALLQNEISMKGTEIVSVPFIFYKFPSAKFQNERG